MTQQLIKQRLLVLVFLVLASGNYAWAQTSSSAQGNSSAANVNEADSESEITRSSLGNTKNVHRLGELYFAGQFTSDDVAIIKEQGFGRVITLRTDDEIDWDEEAAIKQAGIDFIKVPFRSPEALTDEVFDSIRELLKDKSKKTLFHCGSANRVGGVWLPYRVLDEGIEVETALAEAKEIGLKTPFIKEKALDYVERMKTKTKTSPPSTNASTANQSNWPAFRGNGSSQTEITNLPVEWSDEKNIIWKTDLPGYGQSSPVVWGKRVFVTTMQGDMKETPTLLCLDINDGQAIWTKEFKSTQQVKASDYVTRSSPTPVVDSERLYAFFESGELIATDHEGTVLWQRSLVDEYGEFKGNHGVGSSLAINDEFVFVLAAHEGASYLLAVNKSTGENAWKTDLDPKVSWSSPIIAGKQILLSISGSVRGYDTTTGMQVWSTDNIKGNTVASPTVNGNVAYIGSSERENSVAIQFGSSGTADVATVLWKAEEATSSFGSPLYHDGHVYFVSKPGIAFVVDSTTGKTTWKKRLSGSCWASPVSANDKIYFFTKEGTTEVYSAGAEPELISKNELTVKDRIYGVAAIDGKFIIRTGNQLIGIASSGNNSTTTANNKQEGNQEIEKLKLADCPVAVTSFGAAVCDGYLYVYGGNIGDAHSYSTAGQNDQFRRIKLENGSAWETLGEVPRRQGNALVSHNGKLYRIGGFEAKNESVEDDEELVSTSDFAVYDPATKKWTDLVTLPEPRSSFDAVVSGNTLYVVGGWQLDGDRDDSEWHGTAWQIDLSAEKLEWKSLPAPPERRANSLAERNGKIYLIGGMGDDASPTQTVLIYDTKSQKWNDGPALPGMAMDGFGNSSFNVGGEIIASTFGGQVIRLGEDDKSWEKIGQLDPGRFFHRLVAINDNQFVILGGTSPGAKQSSVIVLER